MDLQPINYISTFNVENESDSFKLRNIYALFFTRKPKISMENVDKWKAFVISVSVSLVTKKKIIKWNFQQRRSLQLTVLASSSGICPCPYLNSPK